MKWIDCELEFPKYRGPYHVKNQYNQTAQSFWNGESWNGWMFPKGNCMQYDDAKITHWKLLIDHPGVKKQSGVEKMNEIIPEVEKEIQ